MHAVQWKLQFSECVNTGFSVRGLRTATIGDALLEFSTNDVFKNSYYLNILKIYLDYLNIKQT